MNIAPRVLSTGNNAGMVGNQGRENMSWQEYIREKAEDGSVRLHKSQHHLAFTVVKRDDPIRSASQPTAVLINTAGGSG